MSEATVISGANRPAVRLQRHLPDPPEVVWRSRFEAYSAAFERELGAQEGPPEGYKSD